MSDNWGEADLQARRLPLGFDPKRPSDTVRLTDVMKHSAGMRIGVHSALMLATRITLAHFSVSAAIDFPNSTDVIDIGSTPKPASRAFIIGSAAAALISLLSLSITAAGVSFGAPTPYHWLAS